MFFAKRQTPAQAAQVQRSVELAAEISGLETTWPAVMKRYRDLDKAAMVAAHRYEVARLAGSPTAVEAREQLKLATWDRDREKQELGVKIERLRGELAALNSGIRREFGEEVTRELRTLQMQLRVEKVTTQYDPISNSRAIKYRSNAAALGRARRLLADARTEVQRMEGESIPAIAARIEAFRQEIRGFDFERLEETTTDFGTYLSLVSEAESAEVARLETNWTLMTDRNRAHSSPARI
jgi:hypothetical protein